MTPSLEVTQETSMTTTLPRELPAVCAWCRRARDPFDDRWVPADPHPTAPAAGLTPGICPECYAAVTRSAGMKADRAPGD